MTYYLIYDSQKDNLKPIGVVKCNYIISDFYDKTEHKAVYLGMSGRGITYSGMGCFINSPKALSKASNAILYFLKKKGIINEF